MFQFIKKIKLAFTEKQELLNEIEYLKKRNEFLDNITNDMEKILSDEACKSLKKASVLLNEMIDSDKKQKKQTLIIAECVDLMKELDSLINPKPSCPPPPPKQPSPIMPYIPQPRPTGGGGSKIKNN